MGRTTTCDFSELGITEEVARRYSLYTSRALAPYQRLIQYFGISAAVEARPLDLVNFNRTLYPEPLRMADALEVLAPEHGYGAPDGGAEIAELLIAYVRARTDSYSSCVSAVASRAIGPLAAGIGCGTTGVVFCLLSAMRAHAHAREEARHDVVIFGPQYTVYEEIAESLGLRVIRVVTDMAAGFLPTPEQADDAIGTSTLAAIIAFPGNPAQVTFEGDGVATLRRLIDRCQERRVFLVADNIYEDTLWGAQASNPEVFALCDDTRYVVKVSGPSKDRPAAAGYRIGWYVGDATLRQHYLRCASLHSNTPNSASRCWLALELLLRWSRRTGDEISAEMLGLLGDQVAGWGRPLDRVATLESLDRLRVRERYRAALDVVEGRQRDALKCLTAQASRTRVFDRVVNARIGNLMFLRVCPDAFAGDCHQLFVHLVKRAGVGVLPGNAFGMPLDPRNAWFRMTVVHEDEAVLGERLAAVAHALDG